MTKALQELKSDYSIIRKEVKELRTENSVLRKEILGIGASDSTNSQQLGLLESKTLREIVEETQFEVKKINAKMLDNERRKEMTKDAITDCEMEVYPHDESSEELFPVVEIQRKTIAEERKWMKEMFNKIKPAATIEDGESLRGKTVEEISKLIPLYAFGTCCVIKLGNFLTSDLTNLQHYFCDGLLNSGPSRVAAQKYEVFSFLGEHDDDDDEYYLWFLCSFEVNRNLRLVISCYNDDGAIKFGIGFTPADVPADRTLYDRLNAITEAPDVWMFNKLSKVPLELFISHVNLLVRGHMTAEQRSIVHVEILEINKENQSTLSGIVIQKFIMDGESKKSNPSAHNSRAISKLFGNFGRFACNIEIVNCLNVPLGNHGEVYFKCEKKDIVPFQVLPFQRESFFGTDNKNVEVMFAYEIQSTEFAIVVALKVGPNLNSFAAAFVQINKSATGENELKDLMDSKAWKSHDYRKYANAKDGVQLIQFRNIRAEMKMTKEEHCSFKIRAFAI